MQIGVEAQRAVENRRVFVVESDEVCGMALQFMLADDNETHLFADVDAALAKGQDWPPDLVLIASALLDDGPPQTAGALARIRSMAGTARVLVICDREDDARAQSALAQGAAGTLLRPPRLETVRRKVDMHLGRRVAIGIQVARAQ
ncbi:MAG: hypothetical protein AMXMBFR6_26140 [Betaproteobacteria bacterium]|nr:hypothetical protein [Rhodocyclaceae bacterium]